MTSSGVPDAVLMAAALARVRPCGSGVALGGAVWRSLRGQRQCRLRLQSGEPARSCAFLACVLGGRWLTPRGGYRSNCREWRCCKEQVAFRVYIL